MTSIHKSTTASPLAADIDLLDKHMVEIVETDPALVYCHRLLTSMPGVGSLLACTLLALLPELGSMTRKQVAALVGVAPYAFESGTTPSRAAHSRAGAASGAVVRTCARCSTWPR